jgi:phage nucleotide-binding protein
MEGRMALQIKTIRESVANTGINIFVYGEAGSGKTSAIKTLPGKPLILSAEGGLLSIVDFDGPADVVEVSTVDEVREAYALLANGDHGYDWIVLDSFSEICEIMLAEEKQKTADPRQAYGAVIDHGTSMARAFRDLPISSYITGKEISYTDEDTGRVMRKPSMPGAKLGNALPYLFDEVFRLVVVEDKDSGERVRWFQTAEDVRTVAKDRSGKLDAFEPADLKHIAAKIAGGEAE